MPPRAQTARARISRDALDLDLRPDALSIAALYNEVEAALARTFPSGRSLWVRGEVHSISDQAGRTGHCYIDLVDPESARERQAPVLRVKCWSRTWAPLRSSLARQGVTLEPGMVVVLRGTLDFYRARAEIGFILQEIDVTALLGRLAAKRAALIKALDAEGLLTRNASLPVPAVPLRIALVASPGTEGCRDFVGQLEGSGFAFHVLVAKATVQGPGAPLSIARAIALACRAGCDLAVVVRGGGAKADLAAFDDERVARAIATCPVPVWTGVGHTGDESVADLVANRHFVTPTECGHQLARLVAAWWEQAAAGGAAVVRRAEQVVAEAEQRDGVARGRLAGAARHQLRAHTERLAARSRLLARQAPVTVELASAAVTGRAARLAPAGRNHLERATAELDGWRRLLAAYDVDRQLARGYTLTLDGDGRPVRSAAAVSPDDRLVTRFVDGTVHSRVVEVAAREGRASGPADGDEEEGAS